MLFAVSSFAAYPIGERDCRGKVVTFRARPVRIVSLSPSNTELLFALGLGKQVVGVTKFCNYPAEAGKLPKIGDMTTNIEAVAALKPDLVLAHGKINDAAIPKLERLGLTVFAVDPKTIKETIRDIRTVGRITGRPRSAEKIARKMERGVSAVRASRAKKKPASVLVVVQTNPLWAAGPKTYVDEMIRIANARNIAYDGRPGFNPFSKELAVSRNPDVIVVGLKSDVEFLMNSPVWQTTNAVKKKRVHVISGDLLFRPGPRLVDGLTALASKL